MVRASRPFLLPEIYDSRGLLNDRSAEAAFQLFRWTVSLGSTSAYGLCACSGTWAMVRLKIMGTITQVPRCDKISYKYLTPSCSSFLVLISSVKAHGSFKVIDFETYVLRARSQIIVTAVMLFSSHGFPVF
jgi:hypothetical protein